VQVTKVAGTPSPLFQVLDAETARQLELDRALDLVAAYAVGDLGASAVRARRPAADPLAVEESLAEVREMVPLVSRGGEFEPRPVSDLGAVLAILGAPGSVLGPEQLIGLGRDLVAMREVAAQLVRVRDSAPRVARLASEPPPVELERQIARSFDPDGRVSDDASPGLKRARRRVRDARADLVRLLERLAREQGGGDGGEGVTVRGGRYVIAVRRDDRRAARGIVHGESASGATLFVEPEGAVGLGNELASAEADEAREELAVLRALTESARPHAPAIEGGWRMCIAADDLYARARYSVAVGGTVPRVNDARGGVTLRTSYHPVLRSEVSGAVPFDLSLAPDERTVVISGPNAGGKTVLLKAVGLACAMAQSGVVPPVAPGTRLPVFRRIFSDIGDRQSIDENLSTFSAHIIALRDILAGADADSLVLLDELGGGTDPIEGASLAGAILLALTERGALTVATTHLTPLKELAARTPGAVNASFEFDPESLAPTYRFAQGKPGRSYGLQIARRLGMPDDVLRSAEDLTPEHSRTLEATLAELERREAALAEAEARVGGDAERLGRDLEAARAARTAAEAHAAEITRQARTAEREAREQARRFLLEARRRVEEALALARAAVDEATAREARRLIEAGVAEEADAIRKLEEGAKEKGWKVKRSGIANGESGMVGAGRTTPATARSRARESRDSRFPMLDSRSPDVDLRGLRADEAEAAVRLAIDDAVVAERPWLRIIHGKGTGALRAVVADLLRADHRVRGFHLAPPEQGGSGVTIVELT
jgi:DNA mismatch repair protein MutS2